MAQVLFTGDTTPNFADLDANFTELYALRTLATISGSAVSWSGRLSMNGGNATTPGVAEKDDLDTGIYWPTTNVIGITTAGALRLQIDGSGHGAAGVDNTQTWGTASKRWSVIYAGTGTINTSDEREKTTVETMTAAEIAAAKQLASEIGTFQFLSALEKKGDDARMHIGMTVQRAIDVMRLHGLDPMRYGFICHDEWQATALPAEYGPHPTLVDENNRPLQVIVMEARTEPAGDRYAFRTDELLLFIARGFEARLSALEAA